MLITQSMLSQHGRCYASPRTACRLRSGSHRCESLLPHCDVGQCLPSSPAGDLAKPSLGLGENTYQQLCSDVDTIVHNGALVNHAYSYEQLFEPNVLGTIEVLLPSSVSAPQPLNEARFHAWLQRKDIPLW